MHIGLLVEFNLFARTINKSRLKTFMVSSIIGGLHMTRHQKYDYVNYDQFAPNFGLRYYSLSKNQPRDMKIYPTPR